MAAGVYIHIPFCKSRCSYCDFATDVYRSSEAVERYVAALCKEISNAECGMRNAESNPGTIDTIYFGGGTPSLLTPKHVEQILTEVHNKFSVTSGAEITMEMNPPRLPLSRSLHIDRLVLTERASACRRLTILS